MELTTRDLASIAWIAIFVVFVMAALKDKSSFHTILRLAVGPKILVPFLVMTTWAGSLIYGASRLGIWDTDQIKTTIVWFLTGAVVLFFQVNKAHRPGFWKRVTVGLLAAPTIFQFLSELATLPLWLEFLMQGLLIFAVLISTVASPNDDEGIRRVGRFFSGVVVVVVGLGLLGFSLFTFSSNATSGDVESALRDFFMPIWATVGILPFFYLLALYSAYELAYIRIGFLHALDSQKRRARVALLIAANIRLSRVANAKGTGMFEAVHAESLGRAVAGFRTMWRRQADEQRRSAQEAEVIEARLRRYAGTKGTYVDGLQLDQREFSETRDALLWLHTCQMGHYRNRGGRYPMNLLDMLTSGFVDRGLPGDHGIQMHVSNDGQSWWAWRELPSGFVLGIGAFGEPPSQWVYEGDRPPTAGPEDVGGWRDYLEYSEAPSHW